MGLDESPSNKYVEFSVQKNGQKLGKFRFKKTDIPSECMHLSVILPVEADPYPSVMHIAKFDLNGSPKVWNFYPPDFFDTTELHILPEKLLTMHPDWVLAEEVVIKEAK